MKFAGIRRAFMLSEIAIEAPAAALGTWLRLQSFASSDEIESPRLKGAKSWSPRRWLATCQVTFSEVEAVVAAGLAVWRNDDIELHGFDSTGLRVVQTKRANGKFGNLSGKLQPSGYPSGIPEATPVAAPSPLLSSPNRSRSGSERFARRVPDLTAGTDRKLAEMRQVNQATAEEIASVLGKAHP